MNEEKSKSSGNDAIFLEKIYFQSLICHKFRVKSAAIERIKEKWPFGVYKVYIEMLQSHETSEVNNTENLLSKMWWLHLV